MDPKPFICAHDLKGREVNVQIDRVVPGEVQGEKGLKSKKPACYFRGTKDERPLFLNVTNCKTLAQLTGSSQIEDWAGQWITLFPTTTRSAAGDTVDCIRIRNRAPKPPAGKPPSDPQPTSEGAKDSDPRQPGDD
jgi:hypothetical protein